MDDPAKNSVVIDGGEDSRPVLALLAVAALGFSALAEPSNPVSEVRCIWPGLTVAGVVIGRATCSTPLFRLTWAARATVSRSDLRRTIVCIAAVDE